MSEHDVETGLFLLIGSLVLAEALRILGFLREPGVLHQTGAFLIGAGS